MKTNTFKDIGWVFIYVFGFGISDFVVNNYVHTTPIYLLYYFWLAFIGICIIGWCGAIKEQEHATTTETKQSF